MDLALAQFTQSALKNNLPDLKPGQTVRLHQKIKEGEKERIQIFEGLIINIHHGKGINGNITVRKIVDGIGVEKIYSLHSPLLAKIEVTREAKVRRAKLYYLRKRTGKAARMKSTGLLEGMGYETPPVTEPVVSEASLPA